MDYENDNLDILLKFDFKKTGYLWWKKLVCNCRLIPISKYGTKKITHKEIKELEDCIFPHIQNAMVFPLISICKKEGDCMTSISSKWEISKILNQFIDGINVKYN